MSAGVIVLAAIVCTLVAACTAFGVVLYIREGHQDTQPYQVKAHGWWEANTSITIHPHVKGFREGLIDELEALQADFGHDAVQFAADQGCEIEPTDMVRDGLGGQS